MLHMSNNSSFLLGTLHEQCLMKVVFLSTEEEDRT